MTTTAIPAPAVGDVYLIHLRTLAGRLGLYEVAVEEVLRLNSGAWRLTGTRPGPCHDGRPHTFGCGCCRMVSWRVERDGSVLALAHDPDPTGDGARQRLIRRADGKCPARP